MFKIGDRVRVIKRVDSWAYNFIWTPWDSTMDRTLGKVYTIIEIAIHGEDFANSGYRLNTADFDGWNAYYSEHCLAPEHKPGQLEFPFMGD